MIGARLQGVSYAVGGAELVTGISFEVDRGEVLGIIGPNGAGKSTVLRLLAGEIRANAGIVELGGRDIAEIDLRDLARLRSVLPQQPVLQFGFRCLDVVMMGRFPHDESESEARLHAIRAMASTETEHLATRRYPTLSGGEQARVAFARMLAQAADVLLLDEPTASLDLRHQELVMREMQAQAADGRAVVAVLHDINLAARYADRVVVLAEGGVRAVGRPHEVLQEDLVSAVYGIRVTVFPHPVTGSPLILPDGAATG